MYGRLVGDIIMSEDDRNINQWLAGEGWAFPTFYNSMTGEEITILILKVKLHVPIQTGYGKIILLL
jgi:hypothetical protein